MYPHSAQPYDKYGGPVPVAVPPPGAPRTPVQQHLPYPGPGTNMGSGSFSGQADGVSRWSTGLCHCCDDPANCLITCLCPCITFGQIAEIIDKGELKCACSGTLYALLGLTGFACLYSCFYRSRMRAQYDLHEAPFADCLVHFCCETCALCQEYRELKNRGFDMGIGWEENVNRQRRMATTPPGVMGGMMR